MLYLTEMKYFFNPQYNLYLINYNINIFNNLYKYLLI